MALVLNVTHRLSHLVFVSLQSYCVVREQRAERFPLCGVEQHVRTHSDPLRDTAAAAWLQLAPSVVTGF